MPRQNSYSAAACRVRLHECDVFASRTCQALERVSSKAEQSPQGLDASREIAISYGFNAGENFILGTDNIAAVLHGPGGITREPSRSADSAIAIAALLCDDVFADTMTLCLGDLPQLEYGPLALEGRFDAICMKGGAVLEVFDDYWPHRDNKTVAEMDALTLRRFYALCQVGQSQHARLAFRARAQRYIVERLVGLTTLPTERRHSNLPRQEIELMERG